MSSLLHTLGAASSGMASQSERIRVVAENVSNVDTPGYRRKLLTFKSEMGDTGARVTTGPVSLDQSDLSESFDPAHPMADAQGYVTLSNVNLAVEMADAREAQRSYEANISIFDQARRMYGGVLDLLRR
jgi:flagellar basal-body rod protein FlgC